MRHLNDFRDDDFSMLHKSGVFLSPLAHRRVCPCRGQLGLARLLFHLGLPALVDSFLPRLYEFLGLGDVASRLITAQSEQLGQYLVTDRFLFQGTEVGLNCFLLCREQRFSSSQRLGRFLGRRLGSKLLTDFFELLPGRGQLFGNGQSSFCALARFLFKFAQSLLPPG